MSFESSTGSSLSDRDLELASFWVTHRPLLRKIGYGVLISVTIGLWLYVIWGLLDAYAISYPKESRITGKIIQNQQLLTPIFQQGPKPIRPSPIQRLASSGNRTDLLLEIENSNSQWWAEYVYSFKLGTEQTDKRKGFILPNSRKYLVEAGITSSASPEFIIDSIVWHRIILAELGSDPTTFLEQRTIQITDTAFNPNFLIATTTVSQTTFQVRNPSAYGYYDPELVIVLLRGSSPVAATKLVIDEISPGETIPMSSTWFDHPTGITETIIQPSINYLDPASYTKVSL